MAKRPLPINGAVRADVYGGARRAGSIAQRQNRWIAMASGGRQLGEFPDKAGATLGVLEYAKCSEVQ